MKTVASKDSQDTAIKQPFLSGFPRRARIFLLSSALLMLMMPLLFVFLRDRKILSSPAEAFPEALSVEEYLPELKTPTPIAAHHSFFLEELTWMELRDSVASGKTTAIVPTGGIEQSGPYLPLGKHNFILERTMSLLAEDLGNALVAPIVKYVPEGNLSPANGHMRFPGTISLSEPVFTATLVDIARSLAHGGFRHIVILTDSGDNLNGMERACQELESLWAGQPQRVICLPEYYNYKDLVSWLEDRGYVQANEGIHDDLAFSAELLAINPELVRYEQRGKVNRLSINGIDIREKTRFEKLGHDILRYRAHLAAEVIRKRIAEKAPISPTRPK